MGYITRWEFDRMSGNSSSDILNIFEVVNDFFNHYTEEIQFTNGNLDIFIYLLICKWMSNAILNV